MILIGERINTGFKDIKQAVMDKNPAPLQDWAKKQTAAGAHYLDVNLGAVSGKASGSVLESSVTNLIGKTVTVADPNTKSGYATPRTARR